MQARGAGSPSKPSVVRARARTPGATARARRRGRTRAHDLPWRARAHPEHGGEVATPWRQQLVLQEVCDAAALVVPLPRRGARVQIATHTLGWVGEWAGRKYVSLYSFRFCHSSDLARSDLSRASSHQRSFLDVSPAVACAGWLSGWVVGWLAHVSPERRNRLHEEDESNSVTSMRRTNTPLRRRKPSQKGDLITST